MATLNVEEHAKKPGVQKLIRPIYELSKKGTDSFVCFTGSLWCALRLEHGKHPSLSNEGKKNRR